MISHNNLLIIGTSHIAKESIIQIEKAISSEKPSIIALELDKQRLPSLLEPKKKSIAISDIRKIGLKGFLFSLIGAWIEKKVGEQVGVMPGSEMKKAVTLAMKHDIRLALIDQRIEKTLKRLSQTITWKEKWNFIVDVLKAIIFRKKEFDFDIRTVPDSNIIREMLAKVKERYPNIYNVLITERNHIMALKLKSLMENHKDDKILAIVGAGHVEGLLDIVRKNMEKTVSR